MIINLKVQVRRSQRIEETLKNQLEEKEKMKESLEAEIVSLRKELQKKDMQQNNTKILDEIINSQRPYYDKSGLGYKQIILRRVQAP
jgi:predicted RNase H-like nuclease (RuvC/YqgF family)